MQDSKIRLSLAEKELFGNAEIILTKNSILQKTFLLLTAVQENLEQQQHTWQQRTSPKISKGENYLGLPYVVLDYPRFATEGNLFFIRSMFWWGHFFSSTLQLSGSYKDEVKLKLEVAYDLLSQHNYYVGINNNPWQHHFGEKNYNPINLVSKNAFSLLLEEQAHIKIAAHWPLSDWDSAANKLSESWKFLCGLIA